MSMNPLPIKARSYPGFGSDAPRQLPSPRMPSAERRSRFGGRHDERPDWGNARQPVEVDLRCELLVGDAIEIWQPPALYSQFACNALRRTGCSEMDRGSR